MFATTRDTGGSGRRRTKVYSNNTISQSSKTSLLSVFTVGSAGSGDSNTTITQGSYNSSRHRKRKRPKEHRHRSNEPLAKKKNMSVDVFDFLVEGNTSMVSLSLAGTAQVAMPEEMVEKKADHKAEGMRMAGAYEDLSETEDTEDLDEINEVDSIVDASDYDESTADHAPITYYVSDQDEGGESGECDEVNEIVQVNDNEDTKATKRKRVNEKEYSEHIAADDSESDEEPYTPDIIISSEDVDPERYYRSMSDSGISMGSCSMDASVASLPPRLPVLPEETDSRPSSRPATRNELAIIDHRRYWNPSPGPFHDGAIPPPAPVPPQIMYEMPIYPAYPPYTPYGTPPPIPEDEAQGSAIKIREPSQQDVKPQCFRSFTKVSTRVILQLQDDIAELEGELSVIDSDLDAIEADYSSDEDESAHPGTVRHMLKARESEIYCDLQSKLAQFASALENMQKIENISQPAVLSDLTKHHRWLESRITPAVRARHLVGNDLRKFSSQVLPRCPTTVNQDTQFLAYTVLVNTLFPLLVFKLVNSLLNRLILLIVIVITSLTTQKRTKTTIRAEDKNCILMCIGISTFAAMFL